MRSLLTQVPIVTVSPYTTCAFVCSSVSKQLYLAYTWVTNSLCTQFAYTSPHSTSFTIHNMCICVLLCFQTAVPAREVYLGRYATAEALPAGGVYVDGLLHLPVQSVRLQTSLVRRACWGAAGCSGRRLCGECLGLIRQGSVCVCCVFVQCLA